MMGLRGTSHVEMQFENVGLSSDHLLGSEGQGLKLAFETLAVSASRRWWHDPLAKPRW